jgi:gamma-glutamyltranspeptidase/glutathione hydrolase
VPPVIRSAAFPTRYAPNGMVCAVDHLAAGAGVAALRAGGSAADAAVAASAVLAVTTQHMCGLGGDLFALVHRPGAAAPEAVNASGRAGSGADPDRLRAEGRSGVPPTGDIRAVPVPGCVDGWLLLHQRHGRLPLADVLAAARDYAASGFPASPTLAAAAGSVAGLPGAGDYAACTGPGSVLRRPGVARTLDAIGRGGRAGFYQGEFGAGLLTLGGGEYSPDDLARPHADLVPALGLDLWGHRVWTVPPNSQGYLALAGGWLAERLPLPPDADDPLWAHLSVEAARWAGFDRPEVLSEDADGEALLAERRLEPRLAAIRADRAADVPGPAGPGDTIYLCAVDRDRTAVSLIQSNAGGFGAMIVEPATGIFLQNRGQGFNLRPGHPAEYRPGRRPPHTLAPLLVTRAGGALHAVLGTMGGDAQPQVLLQLLARLLRGGEDPAGAVAAPRWVLADPHGGGGFATWSAGGRVRVQLEATAPAGWADGLAARGHRVDRAAPGGHSFGHAHVIVNRDDHLAGASDPRSLAGAAAGY